MKFPTVKRYGSEGAESMYGFFAEMFDSAPEKDIQQVSISFLFLLIYVLRLLLALRIVEDWTF